MGITGLCLDGVEDEVHVLNYIDEIRSEASHAGARHVRGIEDYFELDTPVGIHHCIVQNMLAASAANMPDHMSLSRLPEYYSKEIIQKVLRGLGYLHTEARIVHKGMRL